jgi:PrtD family type I secretion system ABC transporter
MRFQQALEKRVFQAVMRKAAVLPDQGTSSGLQDLVNVQRLITAPLVIALYDIPWTPIFFAAIFVFHPLLGAMAVGGAAALILITLANQLLSRRSQRDAGVLQHGAQTMADHMRREAETMRAMGMGDAGCLRWHRIQSRAMTREMEAANISGSFATLTKTLRLFLQSAMLGLGAWLVIGGQMTPGGMIAGSILLGRALAPVESILNQWPIAQQGLQSWHSLGALLGEVPAEQPRLALPKPQAQLSVKSITVVPPGERVAALKSLSFTVGPGQAVGVIGPSGAGKSTLARALVGLWPVAGGHLRLDGAALDQFGAEVLGRHIGYLPQKVQLFEGSLAENIARLALVPDAEKVVAAARMAGAHDLILSLPQGYETPVRAEQMRLSGGQLQRIGLARALYDDPVLVVLDEPNANLDNDGSAALNAAIRKIKAQGQAVLVMAHRPAAIQECDMILMLEGGVRMAFGPKQEVLAGMVKNAQSIQAVPAAAAGMR